MGGLWAAVPLWVCQQVYGEGPGPLLGRQDQQSGGRAGHRGQESQDELGPTSAPSDFDDLQQVTDGASLPSFRFHARSSSGQLSTRTILTMGFLAHKEVKVAQNELACRQSSDDWDDLVWS